MTRIGNDTDYLDYRAGSGGTVEIFEIVVNSARRRGIGRRMVSELAERCAGKSNLVFAIARSDNRIAQEFYLAVNFRIVAVLPRFYADGDAIMYGLDLPAL